MAMYSEYNYAFAVARIHALENRLMNAASIEKMLAAKTADDAEKSLSDLGWQILDASPFQAELKSAMQIVEQSGGAEILPLFRVKYDYHNLKTLIKGELSGISAEEIALDCGTIPFDNLKQAVLDRDFSSLSQHMADAATESFESFSKLRDAQIVDIIIDRAMFAELACFTKQQGDREVRQIGATMIDLYNIKAFSRLKKMYKPADLTESALVDGGTIPPASYLENSDASIAQILTNTPYSGLDLDGDLDLSADNYIHTLLESARRRSFGLSPLFAYLYAKETEVQNARIIITCKKNGFTADAIRPRLRSI